MNNSNLVFWWQNCVLHILIELNLLDSTNERNIFMIQKLSGQNGRRYFQLLTSMNARRQSWT